MDIVDQISYLSDKAYTYLEHENFVFASQYFEDAANMARQLFMQNPHYDNLLPLIETLSTLAVDSRSKIDIKIANFANGNTAPQIIYNTFHGPAIQEEVAKTRSRKIKKKKKKELFFSYQQLALENKPIFDLEPSTMQLEVGKNLDENKPLYWAPEDLMNGIVTITGGSGSGKTQCLKLLAHKLNEQNIPCLIFDLHGDIDIGIDTISLDYIGEFGVNPMELSSKSRIDGGPIPHINRLMTQFSYAVKNKFSSTQSSWLRNLLLFAYKDYGIVQEEPSTWNKPPPDFRFLLKLIKNADNIIMESEDEEFIRVLDLITKSTKVAVENRLVSILEHPAFYSKKKIPIDELREKSFRILLKPLNTIDMQFLASDTIIRQIFAYFKSLGHVDASKGDDKLRIFIIIDEVKVFTGFKGKINDPYHILNTIATEARKFGIGMILASQILAHFGRDIRSNAATKLILRTMDNDETKRCSKEMKIKIDRVANITRPGEGFIITSRDKDARHIQLANYDDIVKCKI